MPTTKQIYKLRRVRLRANFFEALRIQLSGSHGISSATARIKAAANMIVATTIVTHMPTVLEKKINVGSIQIGLYLCHPLFDLKCLNKRLTLASR